MQNMQFDFGQNWSEYSNCAITVDRVSEARADFAEHLEGTILRDRHFLDIGFGQGFAILSAASAGAKVVGCDINPKCHEVLVGNRSYFPVSPGLKLPTVVGSVLDGDVIAKLRKLSPDEKGFDVVHSWGVLHHTGNMKLAIENSASLVARNGYLALAIYNRHWSSPFWKLIKWAYCRSPRWNRKVMVVGLYPVIWLAKLVVTVRNPLRKERGMDFYFDVLDWVGGYPYEYANRDEINRHLNSLGFIEQRFHPAGVPTGCNEFIFSRKGGAEG